MLTMLFFLRCDTILSIIHLLACIFALKCIIYELRISHFWQFLSVRVRWRRDSADLFWNFEDFAANFNFSLTYKQVQCQAGMRICRETKIQILYVLRRLGPTPMAAATTSAVLSPSCANGASMREFRYIFNILKKLYHLQYTCEVVLVPVWEEALPPEP